MSCLDQREAFNAFLRAHGARFELIGVPGPLFVERCDLRWFGDVLKVGVRHYSGRLMVIMTIEEINKLLI